MRKFFCIYNIKPHILEQPDIGGSLLLAYNLIRKNQNIFEIIIFIRMRLYFLLLAIVIAGCAPGDEIVGGFTQLTDKQSKKYTDTVAFVLGQFPQLAQWNVDSVKFQVVSGTNYKVALSKQGQKAEVKVYSSFSGTMVVTSYTLNQKPQTIPQAKKNLIDLFEPIDSKPAATSVKSEVSAQSPQNDTTSNNTLYDTTSNITLNGTVNDVYLVSNPLILDNTFVGGYRPVPTSQNGSYKDALDNIVKKYPYTQLYLIIEVRVQVVAGLNYIFVLQSPERNKILVVKVYQSLSHDFAINILQTNTAVGYSADEILAFQRKCLEMKPELKQYQLVYISNTQDSEGLTFSFLQGDYYVIAHGSYNSNGEKVVTFQ